MSDQAFRSVRDSLAARKVWPPFAVVDEPEEGRDSKKRSIVTCWDAERENWGLLPEGLRLGLQIVSTISTRTRRSVALGVKVPVNLLPVLTGSLLFFAGGYSTVIDDLEYFRLCISRMYTLNRVPLRKILVAISLLNVSQKPLRLPDLFDPAMAADSDVMPDDIGWTNKAKTALASLQAKQRSGAEERTSGGACDKGIEAERSRTSASEARATGVGASDVMHTNYQAVLPTELTDTDATPTPTTSRASSPPPCSPTSTPPCAAPSPLQYPLVKLDALLYSRNHLRVCKSTELGVVFKMAWYGDDEVEELEHESAMYAELYRSPGASSFLAPYVGTYEWFGIRLAVVTGLGAEVEEWRRHSSEVLAVVSCLHDAGYVHGDLAVRNVLRFPNGLRLMSAGQGRQTPETALSS